MSYIKIKHITDFILSFLALLILWPFLLLIALLIKLDSKGPALFTQQRIGYKGKVFKIYKFRSMVEGAEKGGVYSQKGDARVTRIGAFIRKTSIDELPQLLNILKGEMSLIGPRPPLTYHPWPWEKYSEEQKRRFDVRPGVTGWAQINGRKEPPWDERIILDLEYVDNLSFLLDIKIFFKTIIKVLSMQDNFNTSETVK
ncbi:MAG: sugar transferase [Clostridiaceae bacterium]|nr:sugar transferase [Clostridiaceae bacterium]